MINAEAVTETQEKTAPAKQSRRRTIFRPTTRDQRIIEWVNEARITTREQVQKLFFGPGGRTRCQSRLSLLVQHGYVDRRRSFAANLPAVYFLSGRCVNGRRVLRRQGDDVHIAPTSLEGVRLAQTLRINDCRAHFVRACDDVGFALSAWRGESEFGSTMSRTGVLPDAYFQISRTTPEGERRSAFFVEVERSGKSERAWRDKIDRYGEFYYGGRFEEVFGPRALRVLVLLDSTYAASPTREADKLTCIAVAAKVTLLRFGRASW